MRPSKRRKLLSQDYLTVDEVLDLDGLMVNHPSQFVPFEQFDPIAAACRILEAS